MQLIALLESLTPSSRRNEERGADDAKNRGGPFGKGRPECTHQFAVRPPTGPGLAGVLCLVAVVVRLVGALRWDAEVGRLLGCQLREVGAEAAEVQPCDLLVEVLGEGGYALAVGLGVGLKL